MKNMKIILKLALRNVLRRKMQSYLLGFMISFTTFLLFLMVGMQTGSYKMMEDNYTKVFHGDFQIKNKEFKDKEDDFSKLIDPKWLESSETKLKQYGNNLAYSKRTVNFALAEANNKNYAFQIVGVEPLGEKNVSLVSQNIKKGAYFNPKSEINDIVIGQSIANFLKLKIGSEIVLMTNDIYDSFIVDVFKVTGIFKIGDEQIDNSAFINIDYFYENITYSNNFSHLAVKLKNPKNRDKTIAFLEKDLNKNLKVVPWYDILPEIKQTIEFDKISSIVFYVILVAIIGLIILNSITLSTTKRFKEFGIMHAIGFDNKNLKYLLLAENLILSTIFIGIGSLLGYLLLYYLSYVGVTIPEISKQGGEEFDIVILDSKLYPEIYDRFLLLGPLLVFVFCLVSIVPSLAKIRKLEPVKAINSDN